MRSVFAILLPFVTSVKTQHQSTVGYCFRSGNVLSLVIVILIAMFIIIHYTYRTSDMLPEAQMSHKLSSLHIYFFCVLFFPFILRAFCESDWRLVPHISYGLSFLAGLFVISISTTPNFGGLLLSGNVLPLVCAILTIMLIIIIDWISVMGGLVPKSSVNYILCLCVCVCVCVGV